MSGSEAYRQFLVSSAWQAKRKLVLRRDGYACAVCGATGEPLHVHHLAHTARWGEEPLRDLVSVCSAHHHALHGPSSWTA